MTKNTGLHALAVVNDICEELERAITEHSLASSVHEGYALILEELDELWDEVRKRKPDVRNMRSEAVQVAAMAMKFIVSMENEWKPNANEPNSKKVQSGNINDKSGWSEKDLQDEAKCLQCLYATMTEEELIKLGSDPCDTCRDLSNWKAKENNE